MKYYVNLFIALIISCLLVTCTEPKIVNADTILFNGVLFTADPENTNATAVAIAGDKILAVGSDETIKKLAAASTKMIDLQGAFLMPGFIEGHGHFIGLGETTQKINSIDTKSWNEIVEQVVQKVSGTEASEWIEGRGWHQEKWTESPGATVNGYPYHDALSAVSPDNPVILFHASGHGLMANQKAMDICGISSETPDPVGGRIVRDVKGNAIGVFEENAMDLISKPFVAWKDQRSEAQKVAELEKTVQLASETCLRHGITSFQDAGSKFWTLEQFERLAEAGQLPIRLWSMISEPEENEMDKLAAYPKIGVGQNHFTSRAIKSYFDGALGSYGAWLLVPYNDKPESTGQNTTPLKKIEEISKACLEHKLQYCVHAIGDRANREILNVFENVFSTEKNDKRWRIEHAQHLDTADIPRFGQLGVIASMQAIHCTSDAPFVAKRLGTERARTGAYAWRSLLDSGAHMANGTDCPVESPDPLPCLYAAVTRKRADTGLEFFPEQKMTREEALLSYTLWNAYAAFEEKEKGSITAGKLADLVVLSKDLQHCSDEEILKTEVLKTMVGGKILYEK